MEHSRIASSTGMQMPDDSDNSQAADYCGYSGKTPGVDTDDRFALAVWQTPKHCGGALLEAILERLGLSQPPVVRCPDRVARRDHPWQRSPTVRRERDRIGLPAYGRASTRPLLSVAEPCFAHEALRYEPVP